MDLDQHHVLREVARQTLYGSEKPLSVRRNDWSVYDFDSVEIRLDKSAKVDGVGV